MKKYIKPRMEQTRIELEGIVCESTTVNPTKTVESSDIDANESLGEGYSIWDDED